MKLDKDCFDELFEYLSLKDFNAFALTCKTIHELALDFYKRNYSEAKCTIEMSGDKLTE